ncbi:MAG: NAD-dependent epimerase/dehydratase family protein [Gammaproteobacteria bacterium]
MADRPLNVCVLGGTGFVGTELAARLVQQGHNVLVPTRRLLNGNHLRVLPTLQLVVANNSQGARAGAALRRHRRGRQPRWHSQ